MLKKKVISLNKLEEIKIQKVTITNLIHIDLIKIIKEFGI